MPSPFSVRERSFHRGPGIYGVAPTQVVEITLSPELLVRREEVVRRLAVRSPWWRPAVAGSSVPADLGATIADWVRQLLENGGAKVSPVSASPEAEGRWQITMGCHDSRLNLLALDLGLRLLAAPGELDPREVRRAMESFDAQAKALQPDDVAQAMTDHCREAGIPVHAFLKGQRLWLYGAGAHAQLAGRTDTLEDSYLGRRASLNKVSVKVFMATQGAPVLPFHLAGTEAELSAAIDALGLPCVIKPLDALRSRGVTAPVRDRPTAAKALAGALAASRDEKKVMVEAYAPGDTYRLSLVRGSLWRCFRRHRPTVVGDGQSTVRALLRAWNVARPPLSIAGRATSGAVEDDAFIDMLAAQGLAPDDVPAAGRAVVLRGVPTFETGMTLTDVTDQVHPQVRRLAEAVCAAMGLALCGIDYVTEDIRRPPADGGGWFLEANASPGMVALREFGVPFADIAAQFLGPKFRSAPVDVIVTSGERQPALRSGWRPGPADGWADEQGVWVGDLPLGGAMPSWQAFETLARNRLVERIVLVMSPESLRAHGLPPGGARRCLLLGDVALGADWSEVLRANSREVLALSAHADLAAILA
jgi:cyanophycin synthetase